MDVRLGSHIRVSQADVQGLNLNLAYFIARSGLTDMENPHAPRVFENGRRVNLLEAAKKHVTMQLVAQASQHMKAVEDARARQAARPRRDPPKQDLRSHDTRPVRGYVQQHVNVRQVPGTNGWSTDRRDDSYMPPHVHVRQTHGMHAWHPGRRDDSSASSTWLQGASESGGTDTGASSSSSHSTTGHRRGRLEGLEQLFDTGLAEEQPDGSVHFFL